MTEEDPNEAYDVEPFKPIDEHGLQLPGWFTCRMNGINQWHGPREAMEKLATDPAERVEARKSKKHHDRPPTVSRQA